MKKYKVITLVSAFVAMCSLVALAVSWWQLQYASKQTVELNEKIANYKGLLYSEMETCRTILGCYVDDPAFCATDAYTEKIVELGKKTEDYRAKIGEEVTVRPDDF